MNTRSGQRSGAVDDVRAPETAAPQLAKLGSVKSADRVLQVLELLSQEREGLTFAMICQRLGLPKSSAHALLRTLESRRFVDQDAQSQRYSLGLRVWELAQHAGRGSTDLADIADAYLTRARDQLNEVVQLAILDGTDNVYIARKDANQSLTLVSQVGVRLPAHTTGLGKALLAGCPFELLRERYESYRFVAYTDRTVTSFDELVTDLADVRARGYATDQGEYTDGVCCTAMPIRDAQGQVVAAVSVSVPVVRLTPALGEQVHRAVTECAADLSARLGAPAAAPTAWYQKEPGWSRFEGAA